MHRSFRIVLISLAAMGPCLLFLLENGPRAQSSSQETNPVRVGVIPDPPFIERDETGQYLNCDFRVENRSGEKIRVTRIEVLTFDAANRVTSRRFLSEQGSLSPALETLPRREMERDAVVDMFNPFHTIDPLVPAATVRFAFQFQGTQRYDAALSIQPVLFRPSTKLIVPLRGRFLVYDGHDYYAHHRRIDLSNPATKSIGLTLNPVRYAYDFSAVDETRSWHRGDPGRPEHWMAYNAPLYAPAAGRVVALADDVPDNRIESGRLVNPEAANDFLRRVLGNYVVLDHGAREYSVLAHLKAKTAAVRLHERVRQDQFLGRIGFSGDTGLYVHAHYQLTNGPDPLTASSLPVYFSDYRLVGSGRRVVKDGLLHTGQFIER
jgi:hypothetical protein